MQLILATAAPADERAAPSPGVLQLPNDADPRALAASGALAGVERIELQFPKFTDGRAFSQAFLLRRRLGFAGDIRATGDVLADQLLQMQRSGFSSAVLRVDQRLDVAQRQLARFADAGFYQGDATATAPRFAQGQTA
ncbi:MAG: DUF934 domain-containing protein [Burkholderiaceae bacterium]